MNSCLNSTGRQGLKPTFSWSFDFAAEVAAEELATSHSEGLGFARGLCFLLGLAKKSGSLGRRDDFGMAKKHFSRGL
jgi:hypothetical protein